MVINKLQALKDAQDFLAARAAARKKVNKPPKKRVRKMKVASNGDVKAPDIKPNIEDKPYTMADAIARAIREEPMWQASINAGKVTEGQVKTIIFESLG